MLLVKHHRTHLLLAHVSTYEVRQHILRRYVVMQSSSGVTSEVAQTGKATQACITQVSRSDYLISQDTASLFLGRLPQLSKPIPLGATTLLQSRAGSFAFICEAFVYMCVPSLYRLYFVALMHHGIA